MTNRIKKTKPRHVCALCGHSELHSISSGTSYSSPILIGFIHGVGSVLNVAGSRRAARRKRKGWKLVISQGFAQDEFHMRTDCQRAMDGLLAEYPRITSDDRLSEYWHSW